MSLAAEFWIFLRENKSYWLIPMIVSLVAVGVLMTVEERTQPAGSFVIQCVY